MATQSAGKDLPKRSIKSDDISAKILDFIPQDSAMHYQIVPIAVRDGVLEVGALDPNDLETRDALNFISSPLGIAYKIFFISENDFGFMVEKYKGLSGEVTKALSELESELSVTIPQEIKSEDGKESSETQIVEDAPVTKIVATILSYASDGKAS